MEDLKNGEYIFSKKNLTRNRENVCEMCVHNVAKNQNGINCDNCERWFHYSCVNLEIVPEGVWICPFCVMTKAKEIDTNLFDKDPVVLAEKEEKELEKWALSIPTSAAAFYCELCHKEFETDEEMILHNELGHEAADSGHKKKSKKKGKKSVGNRSKKNKEKISRKSRKNSGKGKKTKK